MALIDWGDEEKKKKDELFSSPIKQVASVQSGSWQPAPSGADAPAIQEEDQQQGGIFGQQPQQAQPKIQGNYLLSDEKAQVDERKRQQDVQVEEARRQAAAEAAAEQSRQFSEGKAQDSKGQPIDVEAIKADNGWRKYYDDAFKKEKDGLDFWGRLMDGGQASRRAEVAARLKYNTELLNKAYDENGNVLDESAANQAKKMSAYNSALAADNVTRGTALARAIGATKDTEGGGFLGRLRNAINAEKQMSIYDAIFGADDSQKTSANDAGRFVGSLVQGIATMPVIGGKELVETARGRGTDYETGLEEDLSAGQRAGRGVSGALNVVTPFVGGSGRLLDSLTSKVVTNTATAAEKTLLKKVISQVIYPAIEQGAIGGTQAGAEYFGNGNSLFDENGDFDKEKLARFAKEVGASAGMGFAGGAVLSGGAMGVNRLRNRGDITPTTADELFDLETRNTNSGEAQLSTNRLADAEGGAIRALENGDVTPIRENAADGIANPDNNTPVVDSNVQFETADVTPTNRTNADVLGSVEATTPVADGTVTTNPVEVTPVTDTPVEVSSTPDQTPVNANIETPANVADVAPVKPVADGTVSPVTPIRQGDIPVARADEVRQLQDSRAGKSQAEEAAINQELQQLESQTPRTDENLPDEMATNIPGTNPDGTPMTRAQVAQRLMPLLDDSTGVKKQIADAVGMGKDVESPVRDILREGGVKEKQVERVASKFDQLEKQLQEYNRLEAENQRAYADGGEDALDPNVSRDRSRVTRDMGETMRRLISEINRLEGSKDFKARIINGMADMIGTRNASVLTSAGLLERNMAQEITANLKLMAKNPVKMLKSTFGNGNIFKDTAKAELSHWKDAPRNPIEAVKYIVGNTYRTAMIPTTSLANTRRGAVREELTRWAYKELEGRNLSSAQAKKLSGTAGNEMEALVNTFIGVDNGMTNRTQATEALKAWKEYIRTGDDGAKAEFLSRVEQHNSLADQMIAGLSREDKVRARGLMAMKNLIFPFVRTATNLMKTTVKQDLNPFAKSLLDEIRADQRSGGANAINLIKSKLVDYGIMGGAAALASSGVIQYNDGDQVDKPKGWSIKVGDNEYIPVRATSLELPIALAGTAQAMASDIASGNPREWQYYAGMVTQSLPYIDQFNTTTGAVDSLTNGEDNGYAAKSYAVNTVKSFVPFSNNGVQPYVAGKQGDSLNAKSVYDENFMTWLGNSIRKSYDPEFYNSLKDSRDNAGRVRTVDNQGVISNKDINDANTAEFNDRITDLVNFGRKNGLGRNTQDQFNSYDTGKNNNFKSVQDSIAFLDVADGEKPDNAKKLDKNAKLNDLSQQIRNGYFGDTGNELLTLDGKNLKSDASVPNGAGSKNSKLPLSMASIRNAIAQTDLGTEGSDKLFAISGQSTELYNQLKNKQISYEQYVAAKNELSQQEASILAGSKNYQRLNDFMTKLDETGFFEANGLGSTKAGQTYLWNSLNAMLASKGATPAAQYPEDTKNFTPWGNNGKRASNKPGDRGNTGIEWTPVKARQMADVASARFTPVNIKVKLGNEVRKNRTQNYSDRSF